MCNLFRNYFKYCGNVFLVQNKPNQKDADRKRYVIKSIFPWISFSSVLVKIKLPITQSWKIEFKLCVCILVCAKVNGGFFLLNSYGPCISMVLCALSETWVTQWLDLSTLKLLFSRKSKKVVKSDGSAKKKTSRNSIGIQRISSKDLKMMKNTSKSQ